MKQTILLIVLGTINFPVYLILGNMIFGGWAEFFQAVRYWLTPNVISYIREEYYEDYWETMKLVIFIAICALLIAAEYFVVTHIF